MSEKFAMTILALFTLFENINELNIPLTEQIKIKRKIYVIMVIFDQIIMMPSLSIHTELFPN